MSKPTISIILPCYHAEDDLPNIFSDLKCQIFRDFEMVFVNDGGGEKQLAVLKQFVQEDDRVVVVDKPNGGVSSARNAGMDAASGEWVVFTDPDDRVESYYLQSLYDSVENSQSVAGIGGLMVVETHTGLTQKHFFQENAKDGLLTEWYPRCTGSYLRTVLWNKIYRLQFLRDHHLRLDERITFGEDFYFNLQVFLHIDTVGISTDCGYRYMLTGVSATNRYHARFKEFLEACDQAEAELLQRLGKSKEAIGSDEVAASVHRVFLYVTNFFKKGSPLSFREKAKAIQRDVLDDKRLMQKMRLRGDGSLNANVRLCYFLLVDIGKSWIVAAVFTMLFFLKNHFAKLYLWYDVHLLRSNSKKA